MCTSFGGNVVFLFLLYLKHGRLNYVTHDTVDNETNKHLS
jgi:hypothetical protein